VKILFDQGTPVPLRQALSGHCVATAYEMGWAALANGDLLGTAEAQHFEVLVTTDKNLRYQQDLTGRRLAIMILPTTSWPEIRRHTELIADQIALTQPGDYLEVAW